MPQILTTTESYALNVTLAARLATLQMQEAAYRRGGNPAAADAAREQFLALSTAAAKLELDYRIGLFEVERVR